MAFPVGRHFSRSVNRAGARAARRRSAAAFTFVEILMAIAIAAGVITTAVLAHQAVTQSSNRLGTYGPVQLAPGVLQNFYGLNQVYIQTYFAPNYGRGAQAEYMREWLLDDLRHASAVFCLSRTGRNTVRPTTIPVSTNFDVRQIASPEAFRSFLAAAVPGTAGIYTPYRGAAPDQNLTIFIIEPRAANELYIRTTYEIDLVPAVAPVGTYASVRRYKGNSYRHFYDVFYPQGSNDAAFSPPAVHFERRARLATDEGDAVDRFKVAANRPFYFLWWPDPAVGHLSESDGPFHGDQDPRQAYESMTGRTSYFMVVPMFPAL